MPTFPLKTLYMEQNSCKQGEVRIHWRSDPLDAANDDSYMVQLSHQTTDETWVFLVSAEQNYLKVPVNLQSGNHYNVTVMALNMLKLCSFSGISGYYAIQKSTISYDTVLKVEDNGSDFCNDGEEDGEGPVPVATPREVDLKISCVKSLALSDESLECEEEKAQDESIQHQYLSDVISLIGRSEHDGELNKKINMVKMVKQENMEKLSSEDDMDEDTIETECDSYEGSEESIGSVVKNSTMEKMSPSKIPENPDTLIEPQVYNEGKSKPSENMEKEYWCLKCERKFANASNLSKHNKRLHKVTTGKAKVKQVKKTEEKKHRCPFCCASFKSRSCLVIHKRKCTSLKKYKAFTSELNRKRHRVTTHSAKRCHTYQCPFCETTCRDLSALKIHERTHTGVKPYLCKFCGLSYVSTSSMRKHAKKHIGENPYKCSECNAAYETLDTLLKHMEEHTSQNPKYKCCICSEAFGTNHLLHLHVRTHTEEEFVNLVKCSSCKSVCVVEEGSTGRDEDLLKLKPLKMNSTQIQVSLSVEQNIATGQNISNRDECGKNHPTQISQNEKSSRSLMCNKETDNDYEESKCASISNGRNLDISESVCEEPRNQTIGNVHTDLSNSNQCNVGNEVGKLQNLNHDLGNDSQKSYRCLTCGFGFVSSDAPEPLKSGDHAKKQYKCIHCLTTFETLKSLKSHKRIHTGKKVYMCSQCDETFSCSSNRARHFRRKHTNTKKTLGSGNKTLTGKNKKKVNHLCSYCGLILTSSSNLYKHIRRRHTDPDEKPYQCPLCDAKFKNYDNLYIHKKVHSNEKFLCTYCGSTFLTLTSLNRHTRKHTGEKPYKCSECSSSFRLREYLKRHMEDHTGKVPQFECSVCKKNFRTRSQLNTHIKIHSDVKYFKCSRCDAAFKQESGLKKHMITHTEGKPYKCAICGASFKRPDTLAMHLRWHENPDKYRCPICNKSLANAKTLENHLATHTKEKQFACDQCTKAFLRMDYLKEHMKTHARGKPYKCTLCNAAFARSNHFAFHMQKHENQKPYKCSHCPSAFIYPYHLRNHMRKHSNEQKNQKESIHINFFEN